MGLTVINKIIRRITMSDTFYTEGRHLFEPAGKKVILRGINKRSVWDESDPTGDTYFAEMRKTEANSVRIVWAITKDLKLGGPQIDLESLDELITNARKNQLIPMVELHDATSDWSRLKELVDYWVQPEVVRLIQEHQAYLLVNIGNGVGDDKVPRDHFISGYKDAISRMRGAGIHVPLVIDASDSGKDLEMLNASAQELMEADHDKNLIFSVHLFWSKSSGADANFIQSKLKAAVDRGYPLIIGGFSKYGGSAGNDDLGNPRSVCSEFGEIDYQTILKVCDELEIGWYACEWGPGNATFDPLCVAMDMTSDGKFENLKSGWATDVVDRIKKASESRDYFRLQRMPEAQISIRTRAKTLNAILVDRKHKSAVSVALNEARGDWPKALASLTEKRKVPRKTLRKLNLAHSLADWSSDNAPVVKSLADDPDVNSLREVALRYNAEKLANLASLADLKSIPKHVAGATEEEKKKNFAVALGHELFRLEPTAVIHRMVREAEIPIADAKVSAGIDSLLSSQPDFNFRTTSVYTVLKKPEALKDISEEDRPAVIKHMKTISRVQAISPVQEAVPYLINSNLISATHVADIPKSTFLKTHGPALGDAIANQVYANAINATIGNEIALMTIREAKNGTGIAFIDGPQDKEERIAICQTVIDEKEVPLNLETLFGDMDYCECNECLSVYSPAAYFVEVLQYLRNNNLDPNNPNTGLKGITNTPLEKLFRRRPDLGCLELTCENTFTVLPYIDLVNEVMESFVVHLDKYHTDLNVPKQATLDVFNVRDETTVDLLAQPQHVNYQAYCILKNAVYPFTLPYHQPIDVARIFLKPMGTSRYELLDTFRTATETCAAVVLSADQQRQLKELHSVVLDRAVDAEFLGITQEEYIILTKEAFWPKAYFDLTLQKAHSDDEYQKEIGVKPVHEYYGYSAEADMLSIDEELMAGLTFVKKQFLPRTGIQYVDLVEQLNTKFINPAMPEGQALTILESIRFSYRFLQKLVDASSTDSKVRFARLIDFLNTAQLWAPLLDTYLHPDPCHQQDQQFCLQKADFSKWVYCYFERIGKLIVLESGDELQLPIEGYLFMSIGDGIHEKIGRLRKDGTIVDMKGDLIGNVMISFTDKVTTTGKVVALDGTQLVDKYGVEKLGIEDTNGHIVGYIDSKGTERLNWIPARDTCNLDKVRLTHLDGSALTVDEYDRMQRFIRLWHKLGWTIEETDYALIGLSADFGGETSTTGECDFVRFNVFKDDCFEQDGEDSVCPEEEEGDGNCPDISSVQNISTEFLHQLVAVRKLSDLTGLPLDKLLAFWAEIVTAGEKSLYSSLFLTHNLLGIDKVFKSDANGNYLIQPAKISEHMPVIMAALRMKADDVTAVRALRQMPDELTLANLSMLYRHSLLAKILHVQVSELAEVIALFGDPFKSAQDALGLMMDWGSMEDAGFTFRQLNYLIRDHDDPLRPLAPAKRKILQTTKTLYDGLNAIDQDHPDLPSDRANEATDDLIRAKAGLLFEQFVVEQIIGLLDGTTVYTTNAPADGAIVIPEDLAKKLKYSIEMDPCQPGSASIQSTGILTDAESAQAKALSNHPDWLKAIDRLSKQALNLFDDALYGIFANREEAIDKLLAGDVNLPPDPQNPNATDANTAPAKRFYFIQHFLPFLRQRLAHRLIVNTMSSMSGLPNDVTDVLLSDVLLVGASGQHAIYSLEQIHLQPAAGNSHWKGNLIPSIDDEYTFIAISEVQPAPITIEGESYPFPHQQEDPSNVWSTDPIKLKAGKLYWLDISGLGVSQMQWKTSTSPKASIPASALLPDYSSQGTGEAFVKLYKAALLENGFSLSVEETSYWQNHPEDFDGFDFNAITLQHWRRLHTYTALRDILPTREKSLLDLFNWACKPEDASKLGEQIADVTLWKQNYTDRLIAPEHFDLNRPEAFRNEVNLVKLQKAQMVANAIGTDIDRLFAWANPISKFWPCHHIAEDIRANLRARYDQEDWEKVVKPLNDQLRRDQRQALISYLLVQQDLIDWGVIDADSLFEFFLIDVQMDPCMQTSRIKQAISSVQSFVQRCLLGLEKEHGVSVEVLDRERWDWMQRYRIWEANRKVFLYPENWIKSELRDDKSPFYKELESELLQKDINSQTVADALKSYLFKVDEVANLKVVGLFEEQAIDEDGNPEKDENQDPVYVKLHVFGRTRNAPYFFYYRYFNIAEGNWYPWEKIQVDIPSYDLETAVGDVVSVKINGSYLIPVVWNNRLLIFFPQFMKKTATKPTQNSKPIKDIANDSTDTQKPIEYWEIKMGWSEYRNGKWTQKQISSEAVLHRRLGSIDYYQFIPRFIEENKSVVIEVITLRYSDLNPYESSLGAFQFMGSQISKIDYVGLTVSPTHFHYTENQEDNIYSLQAIDAEQPLLFGNEPYFTDSTTSMSMTFDNTTRKFSHDFAHELLGKLTTGNLDSLFKYYLKNVSDTLDAFGADVDAMYHELKRPYSIYNWEAAFHAPMLLADRLLTAQQFDQALKMCHYILNPYSEGQESDEKRFWQFLPFKKIDAKNVLEDLFLSLQPNQPNQKISEWRDRPFQPHVVARSRPVAYIKWVAMKYIEILIAYGDYYFRQNTLETIPLAIQCYVLASHIYGPHGYRIPKRGKTQPQTYYSLLDKWDAFSNAMVELELAFPFSNQTPFLIGLSNGVVGLANIFGFASTLYFCIPDNPQLRALGDKIDDRLFKIRHCQDIEGVFRLLPLFEPPIEPGLLVQAAAQGLSLSSVLNDLNSPMPNYRFYYLLQKALELCAELKSLGNAFLSIKEKGDAEALSQLRGKHESSIHSLAMEVKKQQLEEANGALTALEQSRKGPVFRLQYHLNLLGEDLGKVPTEDADFAELQNQYGQLVEESGFKLNQYEKEEMDKASEANGYQKAVGITETIASILHVIPTIGAWATPIGVGANLTIGGSNFGNAAQAVAKGLQTHAGSLTFQSTNAGRKGGFLRQLQDRVQQANNAGYEVKSIDRQILTQQIRINIAEQEITNQQKQIDNAQEVEEYLRNKYTNQELYLWMDGQIRTLHHEAYTLAYDLAKRAEKVFRFERGLATSDFIQFGYWDAGHDGLFSGERLYIGLKQLEAAYQEKRGHDFEISKSVSLRQINPLALIKLKETGSCEFALPEVLFDMDYPGHYLRRIKSVSLRIPCVVGPYTSLNCTLRLLEHKFRVNAIAKDKGDYLEKTDETDDRFSTVNVPIASIAVSSLEEESGVFELNFHDERYLPFEGAGVISKWRIELPDKFRQFDYDTISDIIIRLRYTSVDGGDKLKKPASDSVMEYIKSVEELSREEGLFAFFDLKNEFPSEWHKANQPAGGANERVLTIDRLYEKLPIFAKGRTPEKIQAMDIYLFTSGSLSASSITATQGGNDITFTDGQMIGSMKSFSAKDVGASMDRLQIKITDTKTVIDKMWLSERYILT